MRVPVRVVVLALAAAGGASAIGPSLLRRDAAECTRFIDGRRFKEAIGACTRAFERDRGGRHAASVAMANLALGSNDEAWRWANLPEAQGELRARRVRGVVLKLRGQVEEGREELRAALERALAQGDAPEAARAAHALSGIAWEQGRYSDALDQLEVSERQATRAGDRPALVLVAMAKADIFRGLGDAQKADAFYRQAIEAAAEWPTDKAYALLKWGLAYKDRGAPGQAQVQFQQALDLAESTQNQIVSAFARVNLAEALAEQGDLDGADRLLTALASSQAPLTSGQQRVVTLVQAKVALARGDSAAALERLEDSERASKGSGPTWETATLRGKALLLAGSPAEAEHAFEAAITAVEALSAAEPQYQGWMVARRKAPFDALFTLRAGRADHQGAWEVIARYSVCEALSFTDHHDDDPRRMVEAAQALRADWPLRHPQAKAADALVAQAAEVLVLHEAGDLLWVGTRRAGVARFVEAGPRSRFDPLLHRVLGDAGDAEAAAALGDALWRAAELSSSGAPLYVGATGRLRRLAFAALRSEGRFWMELRPIARLPSLGGDRTDAPPFTGAPLVAGDPHGDLRAAREEATWVASLVGAPGLVGAAATRGAILSAQGRALLHVAAHATVGLEGARLVLADGELSAQEILRQRPNARVVVLSSCASAAGRDAAGSDSLATAFLRAGSGAVLGTLRSVPDDASQELVRAFYQSGGLRDPVGALARAQAQLTAKLPVSVWSAFAVFIGPSFSAP